jgi:type IV fimbrial biogenesis protein FimT
MHTMPRQTGFTLIELLIVVVLIAITLTIGVPSLIDFIRNNRIITETNNFNLAINQTRSEAINRGQNVVLCRSVDSYATPPSCGGGTAQDWTTGMFIFVDVNENGAFDGGTDELIARFGAAAQHITITSDADADPAVIYLQDGTRDISGTTNIYDFTICDDRDDDGDLDEEYGRQISINAIGRPRLTKGTSTTPLASCDAPA